MNKSQVIAVIKIFVQVWLITMLLVLLWEFILEDFFHTSKEDSSEKFEYLVTIGIFSLIALVYPTYKAVLLVQSLSKISYKKKILTAAIDATRDAVFTTDSDKKITYCNPAFETATGHKADEMIGACMSVLYSDMNQYDNIMESVALNDSWHGEITNIKKNGEKYDVIECVTQLKDKANNIYGYSVIMTDITELTTTNNQLFHLAHYDALTGLPNRLLLTARLQLAIESANRSGRYLQIVFVDLDDFKAVNDNNSHAFGDKLLVQVGRRLNQNIRSQDTVARYGGDEFIIVYSDLLELEDGEKINKNLYQLFDKPFVIDSKQISISASFGVSSFPHDGTTIKELLQKSDLDMYSKKMKN